MNSYCPNTNCIFAAESPTDTVDSQYFRNLSTSLIAYLVAERPMTSLLLHFLFQCAGDITYPCCCCRPHSTNVLPAESSTRNHVAASSLSPQVARKGSTLSGFVQRSRLEREVGRDLHSNKWEEV